MGNTKDLGRRIEIHPMDKHCQDISIGLYRQVIDAVPQFLVHTYSSVEDAADRVDFIRHALVRMVGLEPATPDGAWLVFPCRKEHLRALKRSFLDLCRLPTGAPLEPKPLTGFDKKANCNLTVEGLGHGRYRTRAEDPTPAASKRATALARGYLKICEMFPIENDSDGVRFECGESHDALMGLLLFRAQNVRAAMRDEEAAAGRGVLAPPSQQE